MKRVVPAARTCQHLSLPRFCRRDGQRSVDAQFSELTDANDGK
jgi:hypothetical protein